MSNIRVYQLAKELDKTSKEIIEILASLGIEVKNHMSALNPLQAKKVKDKVIGPVKLPPVADPKKEAKKEKEGKPKGKDGKRKEEKKDKKPLDKKKDASVNEQEARQNLSVNHLEKKSKKPVKKDPNKKGGAKHKKGQQREEEQKIEDIIILPDTITVGNLAAKLNVPPTTLIMKLIGMGIMSGINQDIDYETAEKVANEFGVEVLKEENEVNYDNKGEEEDDESQLTLRIPIVTVMGHVDHGKTSLLDAVRKSNVTGTEAGGITQHIGASKVTVNGKTVVFLDTPGHEAFTTLRARGAQVTDIAILVVAADDGIMPQTIEAINHAKAAGVPIVVAVNKIDKPNANPERVKQQLTEYGLLVEEWGGSTICVNVSAKNGEGIDELLDMLMLVAEMEELKANPNRLASGVIIESKLDKGKGPVATVIVRNGTLKVGDSIVAGVTHGRVRAMLDDKGKKIKKAGPSIPVEVQGLNDVPVAGDILTAVADDKTAKEIAGKRYEKQRAEELQKRNTVSLKNLYEQIKEGSFKELNVIIKADAQGSIEALKQSLEKIDVDGVSANVIHTGVGAITESDVMLATASRAFIIGFNVRPESKAAKLAEKEEIDIKLYRIIYNAIDDITAALKGMLEPEYEEVVLGKAEVRNIFKVPNVGNVAGCYVLEGKVVRNAEARLVRNGIVIYEGKFAALKRFKDDAREVNAGFECGISLERFNDFKEEDIIESFEMQEIKK